MGNKDLFIGSWEVSPHRFCFSGPYKRIFILIKMNKIISQIKKLQQWKFLFFFLIFIFLISGILIRFWYLNPEIQTAKKYKREIEILNEKIQEEKIKYLNDNYGAETPELTYQMFLEALKNKDVNLAIKYFIYDKQELYKSFFLDIKSNNQWENMMEDLLNPENQKGEITSNGSYVIRVYSEDNYLIAQVTLRQPVFTEEEKINNIWKIIEF